MTKYIEVRLTEDQARDLVAMIEGWLPSAEWYVGDFPKRQSATSLISQELHEKQKAQYEKSKAKIAYRKRLLTKLNAELVKL